MYIRLRSKSIDVLALEMYHAYLQVISNNEQKKNYIRNMLINFFVRKKMVEMLRVRTALTNRTMALLPTRHH